MWNEYVVYRAPRSLVPTGVEKEASFDATEEEVSPALAVSGRFCADFLAVACIVNFLILHLNSFMNKVNIVACCMSEMFGHYRIDKYLTNHSFFLNIMTYDINIVNNVDRYIDK